MGSIVLSNDTSYDIYLNYLENKMFYNHVLFDVFECGHVMVHLVDMLS